MVWIYFQGWWKAGTFRSVSRFTPYQRKNIIVR